MLESYFQLLGLPKKYTLDQSLLKSKYLEMQVKFHPDRATDENQRHIFLEQSMMLNEAWKVLKDDYLRAEYMLKSSGVEFNDHVLRSVLSQSELEKIIEMHEIMDDTDDLDELHKIERPKSQEKAEMVHELGIYFDENNITKALDLTVRLKYLTNLVGNIKLKIKHANSRDL